MSNISTWSKTAASNNSAAPNGWPETTMLINQINDTGREMMAAVRTQWESKEWLDYGHAPTYASASSFTVAGDQTAAYHANRPIKCTDATALYGKVSSSSYASPNTTVNVTLDSGSLSGSLSAVALGSAATGYPVGVDGIRGISAFLKTLLDDADASAVLATLGIAAAMPTTGDAKLTFKAAADSGWVLADDKSIGDASSGATGRANADTSALFTLLWTNISDTYAPVSTGRGLSAAADFAAHKTLTLPRTLGRALAVAGSGAGLTARALGEYLGEETHTLITSEMPAHTHTDRHLLDTSGANVGYSGLTGSAVGPQITGSTGGDGAHNNMQPTSFLNVMIKL